MKRKLTFTHEIGISFSFKVNSIFQKIFFKFQTKVCLFSPSAQEPSIVQRTDWKSKINLMFCTQKSNYWNNVFHKLAEIVMNMLFHSVSKMEVRYFMPKWNWSSQNFFFDFFQKDNFLFSILFCFAGLDIFSCTRMFHHSHVVCLVHLFFVHFGHQES